MRLERETQAQLGWVYGTMLEPLYKKRQPPRGSRLFASTVLLHQLGQADGVSWYPVGTLFGVPLHCLKEAVEGATGVGTCSPSRLQSVHHLLRYTLRCRYRAESQSEETSCLGSSRRFAQQFLFSTLPLQTSNC